MQPSATFTWYLMDAILTPTTRLGAVPSPATCLGAVPPPATTCQDAVPQPATSLSTVPPPAITGQGAVPPPATSLGAVLPPATTGQVAVLPPATTSLDAVLPPATILGAVLPPTRWGSKSFWKRSHFLTALYRTFFFFSFFFCPFRGTSCLLCSQREVMFVCMLLELSDWLVGWLVGGACGLWSHSNIPSSNEQLPPVVEERTCMVL